MGEVYRAHDTRLNRDVAIKVLPAAFARDPERLRRFQQEAQAVAALNHPNILAIHDFGEHEGSPYIVMEFLEGETLRERLRPGAMPVRKAIESAEQIARGLAAAHDKGIVHRDLKPENIFVTRDGRVKILDFGLAKLIRPEATADAATLASQTEPGMVLGTVGYMSPEQVKGLTADHRTDLFNFGAILYEILSGNRAFHGETSIETMNAILKQDPPELTLTNRVPPALERIVRHCLEKSPEERFQSARDVEFALGSLSGGSASDSVMSAVGAELRRGLALHHWRWLGLAAAVVVLGLLTTGFWPRHPAPVAEFVQLTNDSYVKNSDGWPPPVLDNPLLSDGTRLYFTADFGTSATRVTAAQVSVRGGELAPIPLALSSRGITLQGISPDGTELLAETFNGVEVETPQWIVPATGGSPRRVDDLLAHDVAWSPDKQLIAFAQGDGLFLLDSNNGKQKIFTARGFAFWPRWSTDGKRLRFTVEDSSNLSSELWEVNADGTGARPLLPGWNKPSIECCGEWTRDGRYYVFQTGSLSQSDIWAVADGLFRSAQPFRVTAGPLRFSSPLPSADGKLLYMTGTQHRYELVRLNSVSGLTTPVTTVPSVVCIDYSPDRKWMAYVTHPDGVLWRSRADGSERRQLTHPPVVASLPKWSPDGQQIAFAAVRIGQPMQIELISAEGGTPREVYPEGRNQSSPAWSADGQSLIFGRLPWLEIGQKFPVRLVKFDFRTRQLAEIPGSEDMFLPSMSPDGRFLAALHAAESHVAIYELATEQWAVLDQDSAYRPVWARDSSAIFITHHEEVQRYRPVIRKIESIVQLPDRGQSFGAFGAFLEAFDFLAIGPDDALLWVHDQRSSQIYAMKRQGW
jgi:Tol biopolymer transport system component/predicted Ser/Thr protein kinase